jgi:hypothetical protein
MMEYSKIKEGKKAGEDHIEEDVLVLRFSSATSSFPIG